MKHSINNFLFFFKNKKYLFSILNIINTATVSLIEKNLIFYNDPVSVSSYLQKNTEEALAL